MDENILEILEIHKQLKDKLEVASIEVELEKKDLVQSQKELEAAIEKEYKTAYDLFETEFERKKLEFQNQEDALIQDAKKEYLERFNTIAQEKSNDILDFVVSFNES